MGFPKQRYWSGFPLSLQGIFPTQESNPCLLCWQEDSLPLRLLGPGFKHGVGELRSYKLLSVAKKKKREREGKREKLISDTTEKLSWDSLEPAKQLSSMFPTQHLICHISPVDFTVCITLSAGTSGCLMSAPPECAPGGQTVFLSEPTVGNSLPQRRSSKILMKWKNV